MYAYYRDCTDDSRTNELTYMYTLMHMHLTISAHIVFQQCALALLSRRCKMQRPLQSPR